MNVILDSLNQQRRRILAIAKRHKAGNIRVFGSVVRDEVHDDSDVDFQPGATLFDQAGLIEELSALLNRKVDVVSERAINRHLRPIITQEAQPL